MEKIQTSQSSELRGRPVNRNLVDITFIIVKIWIVIMKSYYMIFTQHQPFNTANCYQRNNIKNNQILLMNRVAVHNKQEARKFIRYCTRSIKYESSITLLTIMFEFSVNTETLINWLLYSEEYKVMHENSINE